MLTSLRLVLGALTVGACSFAFACSMATSADSAFGGRSEGNESPSPGTSSGSSGFTGDGAPSSSLAPTDNAVILVHAAEALPYRLCFSGLAKKQPMPDAQAMPGANVVGVEVGNAIRLPPIAGAVGKVWLFEEPLIRSRYFNSKGPDCGDLLSSELGTSAIDVGDITADLSTGVHLLVVKGCAKDTPGAKHSIARCGSDWTPTTGNLRVQTSALTGAYRKDPKKLPTQVINLSPALESARANRELKISFGELAQSTGTTVATNPGLFGGVNPTTPVEVSLDPENQASYATEGFRVGVPAGPSGAAINVSYSLADLQKLSSPDDVPSSYYAVGSNYVLLLLGDPEAKLPDGGPDTDPRRSLHFLVVPVVEPKPDGGTDASTETP